MARPSNRETRRSQILDGFQQTLATRGYEKSTIKQIAQAAELSAGLIHHHFSTKLEILLSLVERLDQQLQERYQRFSGESTLPEEKLVAFLKARLALGEGMDQAAVNCWVAIGTEALRQEDVRQVYREKMTLQHRELREVLVQMNCDREGETAAAVLAAIEGCYQLASAAPELTPVGFAYRSVLRMTEGLLNRKLPS